MKLAIIGSKGQLGRELSKVLRQGKTAIGNIDACYLNATVIEVGKDKLDVTDDCAVDDFVRHCKPDVVFNCAAFTSVDEAEKQVKQAYAVNADGCLNVANACRRYGAKLVSISTDYVFDGQATVPYAERHLPCPKSVYGKSKLEGEQNVAKALRQHFIVRTSWLYGKYGNNFIYTILKAASQNSQIAVVNDQYGSPTCANDLAYHLLKLALTDSYGIYHCTGSGICSRYELACRIVAAAQLACRVIPVSSDQYPLAAIRPKFSALSNKRLALGIGNKMRNWQDAVDSFVKHWLQPKQ